LYANINKIKKVPVTTLLGALGYTEEDVIAAVSENEIFARTIEKHPVPAMSEALVDIYKKLRPGDPVTLEGAKLLLHNLFFEPSKFDLGDVGRYRINKRLDLDVDMSKLVLTKEDILSVVVHVVELLSGNGMTDDIDHLGNRRVRSVGEQLQKQFRIGLARLERLIKEQLAVKGNEKIVPQHLINIRPLVAVMREFFGSSQLSQFMDQTNPLAEIAHKRRLSAL